MAFELNKIYKDFQKKDIYYSYKGAITSELVEEGLGLIEDKLIDVNKKIKRKAYYVSVETLQNLFHHVETPEEIAKSNNIGERFAIFVFYRLNESVFVLTSGNFVNETTMQFLKSRIEQLNLLSKDEIKHLYKRILNNEEFSEKGGGGLGMIDILRKTGHKYEYSFAKYDENYYFYTLTIKIS